MKFSTLEANISSEQHTCGVTGAGVQDRGFVSLESNKPKGIVRVFPRRTKATPVDDMAFYGPPDLLAPECDEVHVDVTFTADKPKAEAIAEDWRHIAPVKVGGVAYGDPGAEFVPGRYIRHGYTFTSRGCPRRCWFCSVWKRDPVPRLLPIQDGWNILDDNLLACPEPHVRAVFAMLARQGRQVEFTGGLEAAALQDYQVGLLAELPEREYVLEEPAYVESRWTPKGAKVQRSASPGCSVLVGAGSIYRIIPCSEAAALKAIENSARTELKLIELPEVKRIEASGDEDEETEGEEIEDEVNEPF